MKRIWEKYGQLIKYFTFGIFTTVASLASYFLVLYAGKLIFSLEEEDAKFYIVRLVAQVVQWVAGVLVAFFTNKNLVFNSKDTVGKDAWRQFFMFTGSRFITFLVDTALTFSVVWFLHEIVHYRSFVFIIEFTTDVWAKIVSNVFVVITNYIVSKYLVFNKARKKMSD